MHCLKESVSPVCGIFLNVYQEIIAKLIDGNGYLCKYGWTEGQVRHVWKAQIYMKVKELGV